MLFKSRSSWLSKVGSVVAVDTHEISRRWLEDIDRYIRTNLHKLTCENIREIYFALFGELKRWRSNSSGFTGFSEFLIFRVLYNTIGEDFDAIPLGDIGARPIIFRSRNYEIGQSVVLDDVKKFPDIYVKRDGKLISVIQVKIATGRNKKYISNEAETFELIRAKNPNVKGLFIVLGKDGFTSEKKMILENAGYRTTTLQDNRDLIADVLKEFF